MTLLGLNQPVLTTPRLRLRRLAPSDAAVVHLYASDPRVARMTTSIPHPNPPGSAEAFIARVTAPNSPETVRALDTGADDENGLIGLISLREKTDRVADVSYWVAPAFWNAGYASEAVEAVVAHSARQGRPALTAHVFQDNVASARVLSRAGFAYVGDGEAYSVARGASAATFLYRNDLATRT